MAVFYKPSKYIIYQKINQFICTINIKKDCKNAVLYIIGIRFLS